MFMVCITLYVLSFNSFQLTQWIDSVLQNKKLELELLCYFIVYSYQSFIVVHMQVWCSFTKDRGCTHNVNKNPNLSTMQMLPCVGIFE